MFKTIEEKIQILEQKALNLKQCWDDSKKAHNPVVIGECASDYWEVMKELEELRTIK